MTQSRVKTSMRVNWLIEHKNLWVGFPQTNVEMIGQSEFIKREEEIIEAMKEAGLFSKKTNNIDIRLIVLIQKAREEMRTR